MTGVLDSDAFYSALEQNRADFVTLAALADWHEENGANEEAACLHELVRLGLRPGYNAGQTIYGKFFWELREAHPILNDAHAQLPSTLWSALEGNDEQHRVYSFKSYRSARSAYQALLAAWRKVGPLDLGH